MNGEEEAEMWVRGNGSMRAQGKIVYTYVSILSSI